MGPAGQDLYVNQEMARVACCPLPLHFEEPTALCETQPKQPNFLASPVL